MFHGMPQVLIFSAIVAMWPLALLGPITSNAIRVSRLPIDGNGTAGVTVGEEVDVLHITAVRHGESEWNHVCEKGSQTPQLLGAFLERYVDSPLSKYGLRQVQRLAKVILEAGRLFDLKVKNATATVAYAYFSELFDKAEAAIEELTKVPEDLQANVAKFNKDVPEEALRISIEEQANELLKHPNALRVLLGRECQNTLLVTSNLVRAIDTGLFLVLPMILKRTCPGIKWRMSSNLQEVAINRDSETRLQPGEKPKVAERQAHKYELDGMLKELEYIKYMYKRADASAHTETPGNYERRASNTADLNRKLDAELFDMFQQSKREVLWGLHSIWIRKFLQRFADPEDAACQFASHKKGKMLNTGILRFDVIQKTWSHEDGEEVHYMVTKCKHLMLEPPSIKWTKQFENREDGDYAYNDDTDYDSS